MSRGVKNKLSDNEVRAIRADYRQGVSLDVIQHVYDISRSTAERVAQGSSHRHVPDMAPIGDRRQMVLSTRMEALKRAIESRDWDKTEFEYDRVLSQMLKMSGERGRAYDNPRPVGHA